MGKSVEQLNFLEGFVEKSSNSNVEWFRNKKFLNKYNAYTISDMLFSVLKQTDIKKEMDNSFNKFFNMYMEEASVTGSLSVDVILCLAEIKSFSKYMEETLIRYVKQDSNLLEKRAVDFIVQLICESNKFFNLFH